MKFDFAKVASSLGLAAANYKPEPVPTTNSVDVSSSGGRVSSVQNPGSWSSSHPEEQWGLPSVLTLPKNSSTSGGRNAASHQGSSGKTVGKHGCTVLDDYTPKDSLHVEFPSFNRTRANMMRYRKQMGVNAGSWFVNEAWMAPSLFDCASGSKKAEHNIVAGYGTSNEGLQSARARLEEHWDTWITEDDFKQMADVGINTVRIPIGYWNLPGKNFTKGTDFENYASVYANSYKYLKRAIMYADKYDLGVLVDMHGAYGSQNGQDHSGISTGKVEFFNKENEDKTIKALEYLVRDLAKVTNVIGLELLNEPQNKDELWKFYSRAMDDLRKVSPYAEDFPLYYHDGFSPQQGAEFASKRSDFVVQDTHSYFVFTPQDQDMSASKHTSQIKGQVSDTMNKLANTARGNYVVGEWSCALNPSSLKGVSDGEKATAQFCQAQQETYQDSAAGMMFWSWKMENCKQNAGWCFQAALPQYLDKTYNVWLTSSWTNKTISSTIKDVASTTLPSKYVSAKTSLPSNSRLSCSSSSASSNASSSASSSSSGRQAHIKDNSSSSSKHHHSSSSSKHHHSSSKHHHSTSSSHKSRRAAKILGGGPEAAKEAIERRASESTLASNLGYADGFTSAKSFAESLVLSRVGFKQQYIADSVDAYTAKKVFSNNNGDSYSSEFEKALSKLEKDINKTVSS